MPSLQWPEAMTHSKIEQIIELYPNEEFMFVDGFNDAIIGVDEVNLRVVYDIDEIINILMRDEITFDDAFDYYDYNIAGSYVGEKTPVFVRKIIEL
jgi:hypothetical protein